MYTNKQSSGFYIVFKREWRRILSSKICIWGLILAPLISCALLMYLMKDGLPQKIPVAVVDLDNSSTSRALVRQLDAFPKTDIIFKKLSFKEARIAMQKGEVFGIFSIPRDFAKDAALGNRPKLVFYTNNAFLISGSLLFQDMKTISVLASAAVGLKIGEARGFTQSQLMPILQPIAIESHPLNNPWLNYSIYLNNVLLPGILFLVVMMFTISGIGTEVKQGNGKRLLNMVDNSIFKLLTAKLLPYTIIGIILSLFIMSMLYCFSSFPMKAGFLPVFINYVCLVLSAQGLGLILLGTFVNYRFALSVSSLLGMMSFSISGFSFSTLVMDPTLQALSNLFPLRHFFLIYVDQGLNGISWAYSAYHYAALLTFLLIGMLFMYRIREFIDTNVYEE